MGSRRTKLKRVVRAIGLVSTGLVVLLLGLGAILVADQKCGVRVRRQLAQYSVELPAQWTIENLQTHENGCLKQATIRPRSGLPVIGNLWNRLTRDAFVFVECRKGVKVLGQSFELGDTLVYPFITLPAEGHGIYIQWCLGSRHDGPRANHGPSDAYKDTDVPNRCLSILHYLGSSWAWKVAIREHVGVAIRNIERA